MDRTDKKLQKREKVNLNIPVVTLNINRLNTASKRLQAGLKKKKILSYAVCKRQTQNIRYRKAESKFWTEKFCQEH